MIRYSVFVLVVLLSGCAHLPITQPVAKTGVVIVGEDSTGFFFNQDGYNLWLREGVPSSFFTQASGNRYHITDANWHAGNQIRISRANGIK